MVTIIVLLMFFFGIGDLFANPVCRDSRNTSQFGWHLNHLTYSPNDIQFYNRTFDHAIDNNRCNIMPDASPIFLNQLSLCPWDLVQDINDNRYPQILNFARCRCSRCLENFGNFECKPLSYRIPVLEKKCIDGEYEYIKTYLDVPVGCTCARQNASRVKKWGKLSKLFYPRDRVREMPSRSLRKIYPFL